MPPVFSRLPGRPKSKRIKGIDEKQEKTNQKKCGKCQSFGHNARTCKGGPVALKKKKCADVQGTQSKKAKTTQASTSQATNEGPANTGITVVGPSLQKQKPGKSQPKRKVFKPPRQNYIP